MVIIAARKGTHIEAGGETGCGIVERMEKPVVAAIAAVGRNRALGLQNKLLWHIPDDLKHFRELTAGHPLIMGWKTFQSILGYTGGKALPNRTNIVISIDPSWRHEGAVTAASLEDALQKAEDLDKEIVFIGGGALTYAEALPFVEKLFLTIIDDEKAADTFFPPYESEFKKEIAREDRELNGLKYSWVELER